MTMVRSITIRTAIKEEGKEAGAVTGHSVEARVEVGGEECVYDLSSVNPTLTALVEQLVSAVHQGDLATEPTRAATRPGRGEGLRAVTSARRAGPPLAADVQRGHRTRRRGGCRYGAARSARVTGRTEASHPRRWSAQRTGSLPRTRGAQRPCSDGERTEKRLFTSKHKEVIS